MLLDQIQNDLRQAQLGKDDVRISALRLLLSEIHNAEIEKGGVLSDEEIISVIQREVKKRKEAALGFRQGSREEAALKEETEQKALEAYLPARLSNEELTKIVEDSIKELGASSLQDMGKVMGVVMGKVKGQADGGMVSSLVRSALVKEKLS